MRHPSVLSPCQSVVRRVMVNLLHSLLFLEIYHDLDRKNAIFKKAVLYWFDSVTEKLEKKARVIAKSGGGGTLGASGGAGGTDVSSERGIELESPYERLVMHLYKRSYVERRDVLPSLVVLCASINVGCEARVTPPAALTGRPAFAARGDFAYLLPYLEGLAVEGFKLEELLTYIVNLLRGIKQHARRAPDLVYTLVRTAMYMLRVVTSLHAVPDPVLLATAVPAVAKFEAWPFPVGAEASELRQHLRGEILSPGFRLFSALQEEQALLSPVGSAFKAVAASQATAWAATQRAVYIFHLPADREAATLASNFASDLPFGDNLNGPLDRGVLPMHIEEEEEQNDELRRAFIVNAFELDLGVPLEPVVAAVESLEPSRLRDLFSRMRDTLTAVQATLQDEWSRAHADYSAMTMRRLPHGRGVAPLDPDLDADIFAVDSGSRTVEEEAVTEPDSSAARDSPASPPTTESSPKARRTSGVSGGAGGPVGAEQSDAVGGDDTIETEGAFTPRFLPIDVASGHRARHAKLSVLYKELMGGAGDISLPHSKWFAGGSDVGAKTYATPGNLQTKSIRLPDLKLHFLETSPVETVSYLPNDLTPVEEGMRPHALSTAQLLSAALELREAEGAAQGRSRSVGSTTAASAGDGSGGEEAAPSDVELSLDAAAASSLWFSFAPPSVESPAEVHYAVGSIPYYAPRLEIDVVERLVKQAYMLKGHFNKTKQRRASVATLASGRGLSELDAKNGVLRLCAAGGMRVLHSIVCALVDLRRRMPKQMAALDVRVYLLPFAHNDLADWLGGRDPLYRRQVLTPFCGDAVVQPQLERNESFGSALKGDALSPLIIHKHLLMDYFRWADKWVSARVFDCECWTVERSDGKRGLPDFVIPFVGRVELGVFAHVALSQEEQAYDDAGNAVTPPTFNDVLRQKGFQRRLGTNTPEIVIRYKTASVRGEGHAEELPAGSYSVVAVSNVPSPGDGVDNIGSPDDPLIQLYTTSARGPFGQYASKREKKDMAQLAAMAVADRECRVTSLVEIRTASSRDDFYISLDGRFFGPFTRIRIGPCRALTQPMIVPISTFLTTDASPVSDR